MELQDLEWGDVIHHGDAMVVCEALFEGEEIVVKRWQQGILDDELAVRRGLGRAGVPAREVLGWGDGWMALEDLSQSMWRPAQDPDLTRHEVVAALAGWLAQVHGVTADGLTEGIEQDLVAQPLLSLAAEAGNVPVEQLVCLREHAAAVLDAHQGALVVGDSLMDQLWVMGDGMRVMSDGLQGAHRGHPAEDLYRASAVLAEQGESFLSAYCLATGLDAGQVQVWLEAVGVREVLTRWVAVTLSGARPEAELAAQLQAAIVSCCCR